MACSEPCSMWSMSVQVQMQVQMQVQVQVQVDCVVYTVQCVECNLLPAKDEELSDERE